ncbi:hypothetical protein DRE_06095 [Drechslerella stenobrocha 248]|uniref:Uncharacterized protein n=1 Tax=Drechslerella stenobrocha 248 TaxID=1043628 RepID=W7HYG5_9PEZI|nr:hypothetical protein DRE_06095 [Drechslerella stenobrocha 248]
MVLHHRPSINLPLPQHALARRVVATAASNSNSNGKSKGKARAGELTAHTQPQAQPVHTLAVSIDLLLKTDSSGQDKERTQPPPPLPPVADVGSWATVVGYTNAEGGVDAVAMVEVAESVDLEAYERAVVRMGRVREQVERAVVRGQAGGAAVGEWQWGV